MIMLQMYKYYSTFVANTWKKNREKRNKMRELLFIRENIGKWREVEDVVEDVGTASPDRLADIYTDLTADLAFAQTHYPESRITAYLNNLALTLHTRLYRNRRERWGRMVTFWTREVPDVMWNARRLLLVSFLIFMVSVLVGVISTLGDSSFPRLILGDGYIDMTIANIDKGTPMGVYGSMDETPMFLQITLNNIMVSFNIFVSGLLTSIASGFMLFQNGIMVGAFDTFFHQQGMLGESLLATMLHGTLELSAIIIAGAGGLAMGNGWLFPGTYSRLASFQRGARRGLKIVVGTVPVFVVAGFIETFITRHTNMGDGRRIAIIVLSAVFVIGYFIVLPYYRNHHAKRNTKDSVLPRP